MKRRTLLGAVAGSAAAAAGGVALFKPEVIVGSPRGEGESVSVDHSIFEGTVEYRPESETVRWSTAENPDGPADYTTESGLTRHALRRRTAERRGDGSTLRAERHRDCAGVRRRDDHGGIVATAELVVAFALPPIPGMVLAGVSLFGVVLGGVGVVLFRRAVPKWTHHHRH